MAFNLTASGDLQAESHMQKPNTLLFILAIVVLVLFLPHGCITMIGATLWSIAQIVLILLAIVIIIAYFRKKK